MRWSDAYSEWKAGKLPLLLPCSVHRLAACELYLYRGFGVTIGNVKTTMCRVRP